MENRTCKADLEIEPLKGDYSLLFLTPEPVFWKSFFVGPMDRMDWKNPVDLWDKKNMLARRGAFDLLLRACWGRLSKAVRWHWKHAVRFTEMMHGKK